MGAELRTTVFLRCDAMIGHLRCFVTFGKESHWSDNVEALEVLARKARRNGWEVELTNEGLKGTSAFCACPDHGAAKEAAK